MKLFQISSNMYFFMIINSENIMKPEENELLEINRERRVQRRNRIRGISMAGSRAQSMLNLVEHETESIGVKKSDSQLTLEN